MAMRDTQLAGTRTRVRTESDRKPYLVAFVLWLIAASLLLYVVFDILPAAAASVCGNRADFIDELDRTHSERPQAIGLSVDGKVIELLVSSTGSWSILVSYPSRMTCLVATGDNWESLPALATGPSA